MSHVLTDFVKEAKAAGKTHFEIRRILASCGWEEKQTADALEKFVECDFPVAVPRPTAYVSPRLAFINLFHFLTLYVSIYNVVAIIFTFLDHMLPDGLGRMSGLFYSHRSIADAIRDNLAVVIVTLPMVLISNSVLQKAMTSTRQRIPRIRLRLIYLTFFAGACTLTGSGIALVHYLLNGELGIRFIVKVVLLGLLVKGLDLSYRREIEDQEAVA